jgi:hypothetical protein
MSQDRFHTRHTHQKRGNLFTHLSNVKNKVIAIYCLFIILFIDNKISEYTLICRQIIDRIRENWTYYML